MAAAAGNEALIEDLIAAARSEAARGSLSLEGYFDITTSTAFPGIKRGIRKFIVSANHAATI